MKYEITKDDKAIMQYDMHNDRTLKHIRNLSFYKFSIGDVLVREEKYRKAGSAEVEYEWKVKMADCGIANKYVYVFENELGVGYIRRISVNGRKFVDKATCVTEFDPDQTRFVLDPEYADHMLLADADAEFDAKSRYDEIKKKREKINRQNKKLRIPLETRELALAWVKTLKVGDQIWWGYNISNLYKEPYFIKEIKWGYNKFDLHQVEIKVSTNMNPGTYAYTLYGSSLTSYNILTSRPTFVEEIIN